jgi:hypothetical protein
MWAFFRRLFGLNSATRPATQSRLERIDINSLSPGPIQHEELNKRQLAQVRFVQETFADLDGGSLEDRIDAFKRDVHIDRELAICVLMANVFLAYCKDRHLSLSAKKEVYLVLVTRSMASPVDVLTQIELKEISRKDAIEVMRQFDMAAISRPQSPDREA